MPTSASSTAKKMAGTFVEDTENKAPVLRFVQEACRSGKLKYYVEEFSKNQPEDIDASLVVVDSLSANSIRCHIPCKVSDHEATSTFSVDIAFDLNPQTGKWSRLA